MKKAFLRKAGATACSIALASGMSAGTALAADTIVTQDSTEKTAAVEVFLDMNNDGSYSEADDGVSTNWSVSIPDKCAVMAVQAEMKGKPGEYEGSAELEYKGTIGSNQTLTIASQDFNLKDSNGWSSDVACSHEDEGLSGLTQAQVEQGGMGTTTFTADISAGKWSGICTYTLTLNQINATQTANSEKI